MLRITPLVLVLLASCMAQSRPGAELVRRGDEIVVCGRYFHTGAPVVLWTDPGGYDAYRVERRFVAEEEASWEKSASKLKTPNRYSLRSSSELSAEDVERVRGGGWDLPTLRRVVDQFVIHYDVAGTSRTCFRVLHDVRGLSVHFMLDIDGTIYQTLDVKERAWHATTSNDRSVGIEIANMGAYPVRTGGTPVPPERDPLARWYAADGDGVRITVPRELDGGGVRTPGFVGRPARPEIVVGEIQGQKLRQWDLTPEQYESLTKLTATLCAVLPRIRCDYPRGKDGRLATLQLSPEALEEYRGLIGHYHIQKDKVDPGPAFQWEMVVQGARRRMGVPVPGADSTGSR